MHFSVDEYNAYRSENNSTWWDTNKIPNLGFELWSLLEFYQWQACTLHIWKTSIDRDLAKPQIHKPYKRANLVGGVQAGNMLLHTRHALRKFNRLDSVSDPLYPGWAPINV